MKNELIKIMENAHAKCISLKKQRKQCATREERIPLLLIEDEILEIFDCYWIEDLTKKIKELKCS